MSPPPLMWFDANYMMLNQPKCNFLTSSNSLEQLWIQVGEQIIWESLKEKLLGVNIDKSLLLRPAALAAAYRKICFKIHAAVFRAVVQFQKSPVMYQSLNDIKVWRLISIFTKLD